jgi:hypothetical protein
MHGRVILPLTAEHRKVRACPPPHHPTRLSRPPARAGAPCPRLYAHRLGVHTHPPTFACRLLVPELLAVPATFHCIVPRTRLCACACRRRLPHQPNPPLLFHVTDMRVLPIRPSYHIRSIGAAPTMLVRSLSQTLLASSRTRPCRASRPCVCAATRQAFSAL